MIRFPKDAEKELAEKGRLLDLSSDAILVRNTEDRIVYWNQGAEQLYGYTPEEALGRISHELLRTEFPEPLSKVLETLRRDRNWQGELVHYRRDGSRIVTSSRWTLSCDSEGQPTSILETNDDITTSKRALEALQAKEAELETIINRTPFLLTRCSRDLRYRYVSHAAAEMLGRTQDEFPGKTLIEMLGEAAWNVIRPHVEKVLEGQTVELECDVPYKGLGVRSVHAIYTPETDATGAVTGWIASIVDVSERKRAEAALRESEERYRNLAERLEIEVGVRTKELEQRNADVLSQSEQLEELSRRILQVQDDERRHIARELHDSAGQSLALLGINLGVIEQYAKEKIPELVPVAEENELLLGQLAKEIRTASYLLHPPHLDEGGVSAAVDWYVRGLTERSGLSISLSIAEDLGRLPRDMELVVFRLVQECLTNIHRHSKSQRATIRISRPAGNVLIEVSDQGTGIPPEKLAEIQTNRTGVGIRGMRDRVGQFHGEMTIESTGSGTKVSFTLPIRETATPADPDNPKARKASG